MRHDSDIEVHPMEVRGQTFQVRVAEAGYFSAEYLDQDFTGDTREELREKLMRATKKNATQIAVHFEIRSGEGHVKTGTVTGVHAANGNMLITWGNGSKVQDHIYSAQRPLTKAERDEWDRLYRASKDANAALRAFEDRTKLNLREAVERALAEGMREEAPAS
jgi:hypothetical protein